MRSGMSLYLEKAMERSPVEHAPRGLYSLSPIAAFPFRSHFHLLNCHLSSGSFCGNLVPRTSLLDFGLAKSQRRGPGNEVGIVFKFAFSCMSVQDCQNGR